MFVTPDTDFSNISWNWLCYQRAFSAIYRKYFWKLTLFADAILLQTWLYSHMPSLVWIVWKTKGNITNCSECCVGSLLQYIYWITYASINVKCKQMLYLKKTCMQKYVTVYNSHLFTWIQCLHLYHADLRVMSTAML